VPEELPPGWSENAGEILHESALGFGVAEVCRHALDRMQSRGMTKRDLLRTVRNPDVTGLPIQPGRERIRWNKTARVAIDVVYERLEDRLFIVTVIRITRPIIGRRRP
jgi:uncharacterized protein DUF4258